MATSQAFSSPKPGDVMGLSVEQSSSNCFSARISPEWTTQHSVLGGYLTATMLSATRKYIESEFKDKTLPDPIHIFVQFLRPVLSGTVSLTCTCLRVSSRQCVVRVDLSQPSVSRTGKRESPVSTAAIVTYGDLSRESGLTQVTKPIPLPDRNTECVTIDDPIVDATPVTSKLHWVAPKPADGLWGHRLGGHNREVWISFRDGSSISDIRHLALLADMPLQPPATHRKGFYVRYALSTLCLSVEFKKRPSPTTKWVMTRSNSDKVSDGRYDVHLQIYDESGDILALSNHVLYVSDLRPKAKF